MRKTLHGLGWAWKEKAKEYREKVRTGQTDEDWANSMGAAGFFLLLTPILALAGGILGSAYKTISGSEWLIEYFGSATRMSRL